MNGVVAGFAPAQFVLSTKPQWELHPLLAEPQPDAARRAQFDETGEDGADDMDDRLVGMDQDLAVFFTPDEADR
ncbi:hypothetical protein [Mesorhizobium sp. ISC15]|uniref:hypothetical protein n=1 Tax=Mesorhizobium sp. ISC15 TaxID=3076429 RepID=UPI00301BEE00